MYTDHKYKTVLKHHNNVTINGYTRRDKSSQGVLRSGLGGKTLFNVYSDVCPHIYNSSLYAIKSKEMEAFDWLKQVGTVP